MATDAVKGTTAAQPDDGTRPATKRPAKDTAATPAAAAAHGAHAADAAHAAPAVPAPGGRTGFVPATRVTPVHRANRLSGITSPERSTAIKARESWHVLGIVSEFVEATETLADIRPAISIFGSARTKPGTPWYDKTIELARKLSDAGFAVISGGGPGIMEAANRGAFDGASMSVGLNMTLPNEQHGNPYQDVSLQFRHFFARKVAFAKYATAFVAMPGGWGTLDELMEVLTLIQTRVGRRIPVILMGEAFWGGLIDWMRDTLITEKMINPADMDLIQITDDCDAVVDAVFDFYHHRGFTPTREERERNLYL